MCPCAHWPCLFGLPFLFCYPAPRKSPLFHSFPIIHFLPFHTGKVPRLFRTISHLVEHFPDGYKSMFPDSSHFFSHLHLICPTVHQLIRPSGPSLAAAGITLLELAMTQNLYPEHDVCSKPPHTPQIPALTVWQPRSFQWRQQGFC